MAAFLQRASWALVHSLEGFVKVLSCIKMGFTAAMIGQSLTLFGHIQVYQLGCVTCYMSKETLHLFHIQQKKDKNKYKRYDMKQ